MIATEEMTMAKRISKAVRQTHAHTSPLRFVRLDVGDGYLLSTYQTGAMDDAHHEEVGYLLTDMNGRAIFDGQDFGASPMHCLDSDETLRSLLTFLTLRPGDTDADYFSNYSERQREFAASSDCEYMAFMYADGGECAEFKEVV